MGISKRNINYIRKITKEAGIELIELEREQLSEHLTGKSHGGIGAEVSSRKNDELNRTKGEVESLKKKDRILDKLIETTK